MRLIDADKLDDTIIRLNEEDWQITRYEYKRIEGVIFEMPTVQAVPQWIPVSERLPEENGYYLTTTMYHEVYCDYWEEDYFNRTEVVIAWMPLPKPYEPQESDNEWDRVTMIDVNGNTHKVTFKKEDIGDYPDEIPNQFDNLTGSMNV